MSEQVGADDFVAEYTEQVQSRLARVAAMAAAGGLERPSS